MRKCFLTLVFLSLGSLLAAQQGLNNDAIIKLVKAGLSDELIVATINTQAGTYDTSADGLIELKTAGVSDKVVAAIVSKAAAPAPTSVPVSSRDASSATLPPQSPAVGQGLLDGATTGLSQSIQQPTGPRVFLQSESKGPNRNAARDQSMEMSKDFEKDCAGVRVTINQQVADYTVVLNHIEVGFARDNQFQVANKMGDLISKTKEGGSIDGGVKKACALILDDWAKGGGAPR